MAYTIAGGGSTKALSMDQFFDYLKELEDPDDMRTLYRRVAWHHRCIQLRANGVASVPFDVYDADADPEEDEPVSDTRWDVDLKNVLWEAEAWLSLYGAAFVLKGQNRLAQGTGTISALQMLNAYSMRVVASEDPAKGIKRFEQEVGGKIRVYPPEQIVYFRRWSPETDIHPGVPPAAPGSIPGELVHNMNRWAQAFFQNGAIPAVLLSTEGMVPETERERIKSVWEEMLKGVQKAFRTVILQMGLKPTVISQPIKDLAMPELAEEERFQIASAYGIPLSMLGAKDVNRATAEIDELKFWNENIVPEIQHKIVPTLTSQLFDPLGLQIAFRYSEIEALQQQEIAKAESLAFAYNGLMGPAYEANLVSIDEARAVIDTLLKSAALPGLEDSFTPEDRTPELPVGGQAEGPGSQGDVAENIEQRTKPKAIDPKVSAPSWGHLRISLPN